MTRRGTEDGRGDGREDGRGERHERPPGTRRNVELRREEILAGTVAQIAKVGLAATRVADVADSLGVSPALLYYHFGSKDALLAEAFTYAVDLDLARLDKAARRGAAPLERLRAFVRSYGPVGPAVGWLLWIDAWALAQRDPGIRTVLLRLDKQWHTVLLDIISAGLSDGTFSCPDPEATTTRVSALLDGLSVACLVYRTVSRPQMRTWMADALATELGLEPSWLDTRPARSGSGSGTPGP